MALKKHKGDLDIEMFPRFLFHHYFSFFSFLFYFLYLHVCVFNPMDSFICKIHCANKMWPKWLCIFWFICSLYFFFFSDVYTIRISPLKLFALFSCIVFWILMCNKVLFLFRSLDFHLMDGSEHFCYYFWKSFLSVRILNQFKWITKRTAQFKTYAIYYIIFFLFYFYH